jgi:3-deoxy-D-manno-octulosonic-acid transferase
VFQVFRQTLFFLPLTTTIFFDEKKMNQKTAIMSEIEIWLLRINFNTASFIYSFEY